MILSVGKYSSVWRSKAKTWRFVENCRVKMSKGLQPGSSLVWAPLFCPILMCKQLVTSPSLCKRQIYSVTYQVKRCQFKIATYQRVFVRFCEVDARIWWVKSLISWKSIDDRCYNALWCCLFHVEQFDTVHTTSWKSINERLGGLFELSFQSLKNLFEFKSEVIHIYMSFVTGKKCCSFKIRTHSCMSE